MQWRQKSVQDTVMNSVVRETLNDPRRWWGMSPNMPIFFCAMFLASTALDLTLQRGKWYRRQLDWQQQRRLISHTMMLVVSSIALLLQLVSGMRLIFRAEAVRDPADWHNLLAVPCLLTTVYLWDLAYSRPHWSIILHHLSCVATLCLLTFTIFDTGALQPMLFMAHTVLMFETLEGPSYAGLIAHRVWGCHPTRHRWAGFTLAGAVAWFVVTRILLTALALTRFLEIEIRNKVATSLYGSPFDNAGQAWRLVWLIYIPLFLVLLVGVHANTARILAKLALRDLGRPAAAKPAAEDVEKACKVEVCTEGALPSVPQVSSSFEMMDTARSLARGDTLKQSS